MCPAAWQGKRYFSPNLVVQVRRSMSNSCSSEATGSHVGHLAPEHFSAAHPSSLMLNGVRHLYIFAASSSYPCRLRSCRSNAQTNPPHHLVDSKETLVVTALDRRVLDLSGSQAPGATAAAWSSSCLPSERLSRVLK